jgi:sugar phosphate isomerase/epimerase
MNLEKKQKTILNLKSEIRNPKSEIITPMTNKISRRHFAKLSLTGTAALVTINQFAMNANERISANCIRLGGPVFGDFKDPQEWIKAIKAKGYSAAYCPVPIGTDNVTVKAFEQAARGADIIISEVGAWSNLISPDEKIRKEAIKKCKDSLALAELIGASCCVNISGSRGQIWDGPHPENISQAAFDLIVQTTREIIDEVKPLRTFFTLETMPWALPDSPDSYLELMKAINRKQLAVHLDPVNIINSPRRYYNNAAFIKECFTKLGPYIKSCHAKDILLNNNLTVHLDEVLLGTGGLDYNVFLMELSKLKDVPLMLEHLKTSEDYDQAAANVRKIAASNGIQFCQSTPQI